MKKILNVILFILSFIWQLPQNLVALCMMPFLGKLTLLSFKKMCYAFEGTKMSGGISLGNFAFVSPKLAKSEESIAHEQLGHTHDSKLMGPLYLFIIGIPSIFNAALKISDCYYDFYTERRANKFAGLTTENCRLKFKD